MSSILYRIHCAFVLIYKEKLLPYMEGALFCILKHTRAMHRLKFCVWIEVSFCIVYCCWCFTEAASNEFYFSFICTNVTSSVNARNICFHFRIHENAVFVYLSPSFYWAKGRNEAVVYDYIINIDDNFSSVLHAEERLVQFCHHQ